MEQQSSCDFKSFTSYYNTKNKYDCMCSQIVVEDLLSNKEQTSQQYAQLINKIKIVQKQHRALHQGVMKLVNSVSESIENIEMSKDEFVKMTKVEEKKCKSLLHRQVEEEIILGKIEVMEANILLHTLKMKERQRQQMEPIQIGSNQKVPVCEKQSPRQLDTTTHQQQSFTQIQKLDYQHSPFITTYKTGVFSTQYTIYQTNEYSIKSTKHKDGILIELINFDGKYRVVSIDEGVASSNVFIKWDKFGNGKFLSDCKIIPEQTDIPIPLPINYLFEKRFNGLTESRILESIRSRLCYKKKLVVREKDLHIKDSLNKTFKGLGFEKSESSNVLIFSKKQSDTQLYMVEASYKSKDIQIVIRSSEESQFFKDVVEFMIFILSS